MNGGWIGVDLDGTLAFYDGWRGPTHIGEPIPAMAARVKAWLAAGITVKIFTARAHEGDTYERYRETLFAIEAIQEWTLVHFGQKLDVTNAKDFGMVELWDDRAVQVECNTGKRIGASSDE